MESMHGNESWGIGKEGVAMIYPLPPSLIDSSSLPEGMFDWVLVRDHRARG